MADKPLEVEIEINPEWQKVRQMRQRNFEKAGIDEFTAFRLALIPDIDWHLVVEAAEKGATTDQLIDLFID